MSIASDDDRALHRYTHARQALVVFGDSVIYIHQRASHIAIDAVGVIGRELFGLLTGGGIDSQRRLLQFRHKMRTAPDEFHGALFGSRKQNIESLDMRVQPE